MQTNRISVRRHVVVLTMNRNDRRQTCANVVDGRKLLRELLGVAYTPKPLARVVLRVWTIEQRRNVTDPKPVNNRRDFQLRNSCRIPTIVSLDDTLTIENVPGRQHACDQCQVSAGRCSRQHEPRWIE